MAQYLDSPNEDTSRWQPKRVSYTHDAMIDMILAQPNISAATLASAFDRTPQWVSLVRSSDAFRERLIARRKEIVDPAVAATIDERFRAVTARSLEILQEKLAQPATSVPDNLVLKAVELGAKALAVGGNAPPPAPAEGHLDRLAQRLVALQQQARGDTIEVTDVVFVETANA